MTRVNALLLAALVLSCLLLVHTAFESRQLFTALDRARGETRLLDAEHERLAAERQTQATHQKVGRVAAERLKMGSPPLTLYVEAPSARPGGTATAAVRTGERLP